jgi:hypothetical protein
MSAMVQMVFGGFHCLGTGPRSLVCQTICTICTICTTCFICSFCSFFFFFN